MSTDTNTTATTATTATLYWTSADGQREIDMSASSTEEEALAVLLAQCGTDAERDAINAGSFVCE